MKNRHIIPLIVLIIALLAETYYIVNLNSGSKKPPNLNIPNKNTRFSNSRSIDYGVINYLNNFNKDILFSSVVNNEYRGTLTKIYNTPGVQSNVKYEKGIFIKPTNGKFGNYFLFPKNNIDILVIHSNDGKKLKFKDLKIGDSIVVKETIDLFKKYPDTRVGIEIIKS